MSDRDELAALVESPADGDVDVPSAERSTEPMILFRIAERWYAVHADHVREVVEQEPVSRVPAAPSHILGVVLVHSRLVPVVDLSLLVGATSQQNVRRQRIVIIGTSQAEISVIAQEARGVFEVATPDVAGRDPLGHSFVRGEVQWDGRWVCVLDGEKLVATASLDSEW